MLNNCIYLKQKQLKYKKYFYCNLNKKTILLNFCKSCKEKEYKANRPIRKRTAKQNKIERDRDKDLIKTGSCGYCGKYCEKLDPHEIYGGSNRKRSIKYGFVKLLCRKCHENENILQELKIKTQKEFEKTHTRQEFIEIIGKSYL